MGIIIKIFRKMKYAVIAALVATVSAKQTCFPNELSWTIYKDENCNHVDHKAQRKHGKLQKGTEYMYSGDCENAEHEGQAFSMKMKCDAKGIRETFWKGNGCHGKKLGTFGAKWGECTEAPAGEGYIVIHSKHHW